MEIRDKVIDDSYYSIICCHQKARSIVPFIFINCDFVCHFGSVSFRHCMFTNCTFRYELFRYVYFYDCNFSNIIFKDNPRTCMYYCNLDNCNLDESFKQSFEETSPLPKTGSFIAWKKATILLNNEDRGRIINPMKLLYSGKPVDHEYVPCVIELLIPEDAKRSCAFTNKCRCSKAKVLSIQSIYGQSYPTDTIAYSNYDNAFLYIVGKIVTPREPFDTDQFNECSSGIHFFMSREEAIKY